MSERDADGGEGEGREEEALRASQRRTIVRESRVTESEGTRELTGINANTEVSSGLKRRSERERRLVRDRTKVMEMRDDAAYDQINSISSSSSRTTSPPARLEA